MIAMKKNILYKVVFLCFIILIPVEIYAQGKIKATVVDRTLSPIVGALVFRIDNKDGGVLNTLLVDSVGYFEIDSLDFNKEFVKVFAFGFDDYNITVAADSLMQIVLHELNVKLDEVMVYAESNVVQKSDGLTFNIGQNLKSGNSTYDVLKFTPLVKENNGVLSIIGKESVILYVNGRKTNISSDEFQRYLEGVPAENISQIEVITNPGVTVKDGGNAGIINLIFKKNEFDGVRGTASFESSQNKKNSQGGNLYLHYQKGKLNVTTGLYVDNRRGYGESETIYDYYNLNKKNEISDTQNSNNFKVGANIRADYNLSKKHVVGLNLDVMHSKANNENISDINYVNLISNTVDSSYHSIGAIEAPLTKFAFNLNYRGDVSEKGSLIVDVDFLKNNRENAISNQNSRFLDARLTSELASQYNQIDQSILDSYSGKIEYKHKFNSYHSLTTGIEGVYAIANSDFAFSSLIDGEYVDEPLKNNQFNYDESYLSGYVSYNWRLGEKLIGNMGARLENVHSQGVQKVSGEKITKDYLNVIPSLSAMYSINHNHRLSYNFNSSVVRPGYYSLNPFVFWLNPTTYKEFNPKLEPAKLYINSLTYTLKRSYTFYANYMYIKDCINNFYIPVDDTYTKLMSVNYGDLRTFSLGFSWNKQLFDDYLYLRPSIDATFRNDKGVVESLVIHNDSYYFSISLYSNIVLSKKAKLNATINASYYSKMVLAHEEIDPIFRLDLGIRKVVMDNLSLSAGVNNLFNSKRVVRQMNDNYMYNIRANQYPTAYVKLSLNFGNKKSSGAKSRRNSSQKTSTRLRE